MKIDEITDRLVADVRYDCIRLVRLADDRGMLLSHDYILWGAVAGDRMVAGLDLRDLVPELKFRYCRLHGPSCGSDGPLCDMLRAGAIVLPLLISDMSQSEPRQIDRFVTPWLWLLKDPVSRWPVKRRLPLYNALCKLKQ